jgi:hypothetical protein
VQQLLLMDVPVVSLSVLAICKIVAPVADVVAEVQE